MSGNRLEALKGNRQGQYSIRINDQWRICFEWPDSSPGPINVEIVDYHWEASWPAPLFIPAHTSPKS